MTARSGSNRTASDRSVERLPCLDGLRALAATSVAVYHAAVRTIDPLTRSGTILHRLDLGVFLLTEVGTQLMGLGTFEPDIEYLRLVAKQIIGQGFSVQLADWEQVSERQGQYSNPERIDA